MYTLHSAVYIDHTFSSKIISFYHEIASILFTGQCFLCRNCTVRDVWRIILFLISIARTRQQLFVSVPLGTIFIQTCSSLCSDGTWFFLLSILSLLGQTSRDHRELRCCIRNVSLSLSLFFCPRRTHIYVCVHLSLISRSYILLACAGFSL
jgi:hypothetical protein